VDHKVHLSYRDVLLQPYSSGFCDIPSRREPTISTTLSNTVSLDVPLISAPMDSITGPDMAIAMHKAGALGILTRYIGDANERAKQLGDVEEVRVAIGFGENIACAIGVKDNANSSACGLCDTGANIICLDIANGNHVLMKSAIEDVVRLKDRNYKVSIIAGNVATGESAVRLADCGADCIKVGIGPGAVCTTRRVTGFGVPQLTAILDCAEALDVAGHRVRIIADGGIRHPGDAVKALWAGADAVMLGFVFAGHAECPSFNGNKLYRGMSSRNVSGREDIAPEGVCVDVPNKGPVSKTIREWASSIRAGCSMANAMDLNALRRNVRAIRVSTMSSEESDPVSGE
jgi:IMP dehydrogenase